jgi:hypothetical protein
MGKTKRKPTKFTAGIEARRRARAYYEVCTSPKVFELVECLNATAAASAPRD